MVRQRTSAFNGEQNLLCRKSAQIVQKNYRETLSQSPFAKYGAERSLLKVFRVRCCWHEVCRSWLLVLAGGRGISQEIVPKGSVW